MKNVPTHLTQSSVMVEELINEDIRLQDSIITALRTMASEADYWNSIPPKHRAMLKRFIDGEDISKPQEIG